MLSVADQRRRRRCRNRRRCDIRHCSCELQLVKRLAREAKYHRRIRRTIARKLLYRRPHGTRARGRIRFIPKNANYEFLRCISNVVGVPVVFSFFSFLSSSFPHFFSLSNGGGSLPSEESRNIAAAYGIGIPRLWVGIHKIFVRRLTTTRAHRCFPCVKYTQIVALTKLLQSSFFNAPVGV